MAALAIGIVCVLAVAFWLLLFHPPAQLRPLSASLRALIDAVTRTLGLGAKLRIGVSFVQCVSAVGKTYAVTLPPEYYDWMEPFDWLNIEWLGALLPAECVGSFERRMLMVALIPLALLALIMMGGVAVSRLKGSRVERRLNTLLQASMGASSSSSADRRHHRSPAHLEPKSPLRRAASTGVLAKRRLKRQLSYGRNAAAHRLMGSVYPCLLLVFLFAPGTNRAIFRA